MMSPAVPGRAVLESRPDRRAATLPAGNRTAAVSGRTTSGRSRASGRRAVTIPNGQSLVKACPQPGLGKTPRRVGGHEAGGQVLPAVGRPVHPRRLGRLAKSGDPGPARDAVSHAAPLGGKAQPAPQPEERKPGPSEADRDRGRAWPPSSAAWSSSASASGASRAQLVARHAAMPSENSPATARLPARGHRGCRAFLVMCSSSLLARSRMVCLLGCGFPGPWIPGSDHIAPDWAGPFFTLPGPGPFCNSFAQRKSRSVAGDFPRVHPMASGP